MTYERGKKKAICPTIAALKVASQNESKAVAFMEAKRWPDGADCPYCQSRAVYQMRKRGTEEREKNHRWRCKQCNTMFSVRTGTVMEETRLPLRVWCLAMWRACASKKGVSALQISREANISYKSALFLMHRVRYAMDNAPDAPPPMTGDIEVDETYVGGKPRKRNKEKNQGMYHTRKASVVAMVQRSGEVRGDGVGFRSTCRNPSP